MFKEIIETGLAQRYPIPYFSYSQLSSFKRCPRTFFLTYLTGKFEQRGNKYTVLGSILHDIFEKQGKGLINDGSLTKGEAIRQFNNHFLSLKDDPKKKSYFDNKEDFINMYQRGVVAINNYYEMYDSKKPLFVERKFRGVISDGLPPAVSYIDRIDGDALDASTWIVTDYKTGGSPKSKEHLRNDFQLGLYAAQIYAEFDKYPRAVQFVHPVPQKTQTAIHQGDGIYRFKGQREPVVSFAVTDVIMEVRETLANIVRSMDDDNFPLKPDPWGCKMCFHQDGTCQPFTKQQQGWVNI